MVSRIHQEIIFEVNVKDRKKNSKGNQYKSILCADVRGKRVYRRSNTGLAFTWKNKISFFLCFGPNYRCKDIQLNFKLIDQCWTNSASNAINAINHVLKPKQLIGRIDDDHQMVQITDWVIIFQLKPPAVSIDSWRNNFTDVFHPPNHLYWVKSAKPSGHNNGRHPLAWSAVVNVVAEAKPSAKQSSYRVS